MRKALSELLRRRVLHIVGVYLAAGWGLIEFSDWATARFRLDGVLSGWLLALLVVGLPVVFIASWSLGERRDAGRDVVAAPPRSVAEND